MSGLEIEWDHTKPPGSRVKSIHLIVPVQKEDVDDPEDLIDFVEQEDGTRVEVKQRPPQRGEEIKNECGGRIYRVVSGSLRLFCIAEFPDHSRIHGAGVGEGNPAL